MPLITWQLNKRCRWHVTMTSWGHVTERYVMDDRRMRLIRSSADQSVVVCIIRSVFISPIWIYVCACDCSSPSDVNSSNEISYTNMDSCRGLRCDWLSRGLHHNARGRKSLAKTPHTSIDGLQWRVSATETGRVLCSRTLTRPSQSQSPITTTLPDAKKNN